MGSPPTKKQSSKPPSIFPLIFSELNPWNLAFSIVLNEREGGSFQMPTSAKDPMQINQTHISFSLSLSYLSFLFISQPLT